MSLTVTKPGTISSTESGVVTIDGWHFERYGKSASVGDAFLAIAKWLADNGRHDEARLILERERRMRS